MDIVFVIFLIVPGGTYLFFAEKGLEIHKLHLKQTRLFNNPDGLTARNHFLRIFGFILLRLGLYILVFP